MFKIRRIRPDEGLQFRKIRLRALADAPDAFGTTLAEAQAQTDAYWHQRVAASASSNTRFLAIAKVGDKWVGVAGGMFEDENTEVAEIVSVWVDPDHRRSGVAAALLETVTDWARGRGAKRLHLWVTETNEPARKLYRRVGFIETGEMAPVREESELVEVQLWRAL